MAQMKTWSMSPRMVNAMILALNSVTVKGIEDNRHVVTIMTSLDDLKPLAKLALETKDEKKIDDPYLKMTLPMGASLVLRRILRTAEVPTAYSRPLVELHDAVETAKDVPTVKEAEEA